MKQNKYDPLENLVNKKNLRKQFKAIRDEIKNRPRKTQTVNC